MNSLYSSKIIIVEDNEFSRYYVYTKLKKEGYQNLSMPESSVEAWEEIAEATVQGEPFDLVITDLNMPDLDGMDLISKIKEDPMSADTNILVISADAEMAIQDICLTLGAIAYMTKPVVAEELSAVVEAILTGSKIPEIKGMFAPIPKIS